MKSLILSPKLKSGKISKQKLFYGRVFTSLETCTKELTGIRALLVNLYMIHAGLHYLVLESWYKPSTGREKEKAMKAKVPFHRNPMILSQMHLHLARDYGQVWGQSMTKQNVLGAVNQSHPNTQNPN